MELVHDGQEMTRTHILKRGARFWDLLRKVPVQIEMFSTSAMVLVPTYSYPIVSRCYASIYTVTQT